ncbi:MAG: lycopene cyclase domain-containing protein [Bacteroidetes Order II. Incertae sedis bacterium]|nr:lycopene cyclase domain-containing protein [Bacteroidetes Order II. bacterium]
MTYLQFHFVFILPVIGLLWYMLPSKVAGTQGKHWFYLLAVMGIAFVYTTPWDNYLVYRGIWGYGNERVIGVIGYVPIEEYLFFLLQPILTGLFFFQLYTRRKSERPTGLLYPYVRYVGVTFWLLAACAGVYMLTFDKTTYMGLILAWAAPVFAGMWYLIGSALWDIRRTFIWSLSIPTVYLWIADRIAIGLGIWEISRNYTIGWHILGLPIEEATFFLITNLLCLGGLSIFMRFWEGDHPKIETE